MNVSDKLAKYAYNYKGTSLDTLGAMIVLFLNPDYLPQQRRWFIVTFCQKRANSSKNDNDNKKLVIHNILLLLHSR